MQNGYQLFIPKEVWRRLSGDVRRLVGGMAECTVGSIVGSNGGQRLSTLLWQLLPAPQTQAGQWLLKQRHYGPALVQQIEKKCPATVRSALLQQLLRLVFAKAAFSGSLDFLQGKRLTIEVPDLQMHYDLGLDQKRIFWLNTAGTSARAITGEVFFRAESADLLLLLTQQVDPDTLFFQRRLTILGDTELGLQLKNYLDTLEPEQLLPPQLLAWLQAIAT